MLEGYIINTEMSRVLLCYAGSDSRQSICIPRINRALIPLLIIRYENSPPVGRGIFFLRDAVVVPVSERFRAQFFARPSLSASLSQLTAVESLRISRQSAIIHSNGYIIHVKHKTVKIIALIHIYLARGSRDRVISH